MTGRAEHFANGAGYELRDESTMHNGAVKAYHQGSKVGELIWHNRDSPAGISKKGEIFMVQTTEPHRGKGLATAMLNHAKSIEPALHHGKAVTPEGASFIKNRPL